jgi:putative transposase
MYHRRSVRLKGFDYSQNGYYFVTICLQNRECLLGNIIQGKMMLFDAGLIVNEWWQKLPTKYLGVRLDEFIVMPNHVHGIINIDVGAGYSRPQTNNSINIEGREDRAPTLGNIVAYFKYQTTKQYNQDGAIRKLWQRNYYEHIIRDEKEYCAIKQYIQDNPKNWEDDEMFSG